MKTFEQINGQMNAGLLSKTEARNELDQLGIRGDWRDDGSFIGYNYRSQAWIDTAAE